MRKTTVILTALIMGSCFLPIGVFAQSGNANDCNEFGSNSPPKYVDAVIEGIERMKRDELTVFTDQDMMIALNHLKFHCCESGDLSDDTCASIPEPERRWYPESPYIVDQLMYIGMKKLDGNQEHCDILGIDCQPRKYDVDPVAWRNEITKIAEDIKGYPPSLIHGKYEETWSKENTISVLDEPNLSKAYREMCTDLGSIRAAVGTNQAAVDAKLTGGKSVQDLCNERGALRKKQEAQYIRLLQLEKGRLYLVDNLRAYLHTYFIDSRLAGLMGKYASLDSCYATVLRYVEKTTCCNQ